MSKGPSLNDVPLFLPSDFTEEIPDIISDPDAMEHVRELLASGYQLADIEAAITHIQNGN